MGFKQIINPVIIILLLKLNTTVSDNLFYPEDISSLDYLVTSESGNEYHLASFYPTDDTEIYKDLKNGILIFPLSTNNIFSLYCSSVTSAVDTMTSITTTDTEWTILTMESANTPPRLFLNQNNFQNNNFVFNVISPVSLINNDEISILKFSNTLFNNNNDIIYNIYLWFSPNTVPTLSIHCAMDNSCASYGSGKIIGNFNPGETYQILFSYYNNNNFVFPNKGNLECPTNKLYINGNIKIKQIKLTYTLNNDISCTSSSNCPTGFYCKNSLCEKCDGRASVCESKTSIKRCGRFTQQWETPIVTDSSSNPCIADYFNINSMDKITFSMSPIKDGAASMSFWFYTIKPDSTNNGILHITLSDFVTVTIIANELHNYYDIYVIGYELYHKAYGKVINEIKDRNEFLNFITNIFPFKNWYIKKTIQKVDRWVYIRVGFNYHMNSGNTNKLSLIIQYLKKDSSESFSETVNKNLDNEYIYGIEGLSDKQSTIHYKKFYRSYDHSYVYITNYNYNNQIYLKNLYVFATDLPNTGTDGFQYYAFESIFESNIDFPELILASPFNNIEGSDGSYKIKYYFYDTSITSGNNKIEITTIVTGGTDDTVFSYYPKLYRLNLITNENNYFSNYDLQLSSLTVSSNIKYLFNDNKGFSCDSGYYVNISSMTCQTSCENQQNVMKGLNINDHGICTTTCDNSFCRNTNVKGTSCMSNYFDLYDICLVNEDSTQNYTTSVNRGSLYYSYFYNLPTITIRLPTTYNNYYLKFNFRFEPNKFIRPGIEFKGNKIYIIYTDSFKIWHDYHFTYIGIEDSNGNNGKNLRPFFNLDNKNQFLIRVKYENEIYKGSIYLNNNLNYQVSFTASPLSQFIFCHVDQNEDNCKNIYWTSGFYDNIRIYNVDNNDLINDNTVYNSHIYDDVFDYLNYVNQNTPFNPIMIDTIDIPLSLKSIRGNKLTMINNNKDDSSVRQNSQIINLIPTSNPENIQLYNYGEKQDIPHRKTAPTTGYTEYTSPEGNDIECVKGVSCYGEGIPSDISIDTNKKPDILFSQECRVCNNQNYYFKFSNCEIFPSLYKGYYVLPFPFYENSGENSGVVESGNRNIVINTITSYKNDRFAISFWLKLISFPDKNDNYAERIIGEFGNLIIGYLINSKKMIFHKSDETTTYIASSDYPSEYFGKYIHISYSYYKYGLGFTSYFNNFFSIQINNKEIPISSSNTNKDMNLNSIIFYSNNFYGTMAKFDIYNYNMIGSYAFTTNTYYTISPIIKVIDGEHDECLNGENIKCIIDYDIVFDEKQYPSSAFPLPKKIYQTENDAYTIEDCNDKCGSFCYSKDDEESCACSNENFYDYLVFSQDKTMVKCRKLDAFDIQRFKEIQIKNLPSTSDYKGGFDFWIFIHFTKLYKESISNGLALKIEYGININIKVDSIEFNIATISYLKDKWYHIKYDSRNGLVSIKRAQNNLPIHYSINKDNLPNILKILRNIEYSVGLIIIRQFKIWTDMDKYNENLENIEIIHSFHRTGLGAVIDTKINSEKKFQIYLNSNAPYNNNDNIYIEKNNDVNQFGYYPLENNIYSPLELCSESEKCNDILKLNGLDTITFDNIPASGTNSYSIDIWIKIQNPEQFLNGINIIWNKHISLSVVANKENDKLMYYCFPQDYLYSPYDLEGREIINLANTPPLNIDKFSIDISSINNHWVHVRGAYSWDNELFYVKGIKSDTGTDIYEGNTDGNIEKIVTKENTYNPNGHIDYPFKYFLNEKSELYIQNAKKNTNSPVTIRTLYLYNEYLPPSYKTERISYIISNVYTPITPLIFSIDFSEIPVTSGLTSLNLKHYIKETLTPNVQNLISDYIMKGEVELCELNSGKIFDSNDYQCVTSSLSIINAKYYYGNNILECDTGSGNYYLKSNLCILNTCENNKLTTTPGTKSFCSYNIDDSKHESFTASNFANYQEDLKCGSSYSRVGYKCMLKEKQKTASFYFNRCYNFLPIYKTFTATQLELTKNSYAIEFWFKLDKVNEFCSNDIAIRYVFWAYPHSFIQYAGNDDVYYNDLYEKSINPVYSPIKIERIHPYEWNFIVIEYKRSTRSVNIYVNLKSSESDYSYSISNSNLNIYNVKAIAFCNGNEFTCKPLGSQLNINWGAAYYNKIRIYSLGGTSINVIMENIQSKVQTTPSSVKIYYLFNNINNDLNIVYDENDRTDVDKQLNFNNLLNAASIYNKNDKVLLYSSTANFDWGEVYTKQYVIEQNPITGVVTSFGHCALNCKRCYSEKENDCYECLDGYTLSNNECKRDTSYYPQISNDDNINDMNINFAKTGFNIDTINPITITIWMKFYGVKYGINGDILSNCVLIVKISSNNNLFACYNTDTDIIEVYYKDSNTVLYKDTSFLELSGTWVLLSFSSYNSNLGDYSSTSYYPLMFSFAINGLTISQTSNTISEPGIVVDTITIGSKISATFTDIRVYKSFILNPYGTVTNDESYNKELVFNLPLQGTSDTNCISSNDLYDSYGDLFYRIKCYPDYNIYQDSEYHCSHNKDKMIDYFSGSTECLNCIDECYYCGGDNKLNCACYYNDYYWFRNDKIKSKLYCQRLPYHDFNKYSQVEFNDISYATTNEYAIEFWYFIYEYKTDNILFKKQTIQWTNHIKIEISKKDNNYVYVDCYPLNNHKDSIKDRDETQKYFKWNHVLCGITIKKKLYYLNDRTYIKLSDSDVSGIDYSTFGSSKTKLIIKNEEISNTSHGAILIKELRLWELYSMREFPTDCKYNAEYMKTGSIPFLLHYYPFTVPKTNLMTDSKGNEPNIKIEKNNIIGYNIIDYTNIYSIDEDFEECLITLTIPSIGYFNLTNFLIENKQLTSYTDLNYKYSYYISEDAKLKYDDITTKTLSVTNDNTGNPVSNEALLEKLTNDEFINADINLYIKETNPTTSNTKIGFGRIVVINYEKGKDINLRKYTIGIDDNLNVDSDNLDSKVILTPHQLWDRLKVIVSLGDINNAARANINMTDTQINYDVHNKEIEPYNISTENPLCSEASCSYEGDCYIVVRATSCSCYSGYTGMNCHVTNENKEFLDELFMKYWNYYTNNNDYTTLDVTFDITNTFIEQIMFLVKGATVFSSSSETLFGYFYNFIDYLEINKLNALGDNYIAVLKTFDFLSIALYENINSFRRENYIDETADTTYNDIKIEDNVIQGLIGRVLEILNDDGNEEKQNEYESDNTKTNYTQKWVNATSLTEDQLINVYDNSEKLIEYIEKIILYGIASKKPEIYMSLQGIDVTIKPTTISFNYNTYFNEKIVEDRKKRFFYRSFVDSSNCSSLIFNSNNQLYLVIIQFRYNPLSFHSIYSKSASFLNDIFYATSDGEKVDISECSNNMQIFFPFNIYNKTKTKFMASHSSFLSLHMDVGPKHPYVSWPVYVYGNGTVCKKDRITRINEVKPLMDINCTSYDSNLRISERRNDITIGDNFYVSCPTNHYSLFTLEVDDADANYKLAHLFFYLEAPQVFKCGENWSNSCFICFIILLAFVIIGIVIITIYDFISVMRTKNLLDNVKVEILRENKMYYDGRTLEEDLNYVNRIYNQEQIERDFKINNIKEPTNTNTQSIYTEKNKRNSSRNKRKKSKSMIGSNEKSNSYSLNEISESNDNSNSNSANPPKKYNYDASEEGQTTENYDHVEPSSRKKLALKNKKKSEEEDIETNTLDNHQTDFFSRFAATKNNAYIEKTPGKLTIVKELDTRIEVPDIFEDIEKNNLNCFQFFIWCEIRRNVYISPFTLKSAVNPKWKRIFCIYIYLLLQYFWNVIFLTFVERSGMSRITKMLTMHIPQLFVSSLCLYPIIWFFRVDNPTKILLLKTLRSSEQMKLIYEWKQMKKRQRRKLIFGIILFCIVFFISFYFSFNYCAVLYYSRKTFIMTFLTGILFDLVVYEGLMNLLLSMVYCCKGVHLGKAFKKFFLFRSYRNCI